MSKFSFYFIVYTPMRASDVISKVTKENMNRHGVDIQCLTFEALETQKEKKKFRQF